MSNTFWAIKRRELAKKGDVIVEKVTVKAAKPKKAKKKPAKNDATVKVEGKKVVADTTPESNDADVTVEPA
jgi:hypothetical protein